MRRHPLVAFLVLAVLSNVAGSVFSILYNDWLIVRHYLAPHPRQVEAFWRTVWVYNLVVYPACVAVVAALLRPLARCRRQLLAGGPVSPGLLARCHRRLVNLPALQVGVNFLGWIPGAVVFPLGIGLFGGWEDIGVIWWQFAVSFLVSALLTTVQTYFLMEAFLFKYVYPDFFRDDRPAAVEGGVFRISFRQRMILYWVAIALGPLTALLVVELNASTEHAAWLNDLRHLALGVTAIGVVSSAVIGLITGRTLLTWLKDHSAATDQIMAGNYDYRIEEKRPAEFGRLTDRFNDMAAELGRARRERETFGQMVGPEVRDEMYRYPGLGGEVEQVTVMFIDIRGFSRRSAGEPPERVVALLNRFFTLSFLAIGRHCGHVNKFLGDGLMALFGVPRACEDHADRAVAAALDLLTELARLNDELKREGQEPLAVGIGIHTGPALVGCVGATLNDGGGRGVTRKEFTAIGETVNLAQRVEQLTKGCGGPVLLSQATRQRLRSAPPTECLGRQEIAGFPGGMVVHRVVENPGGATPGLEESHP
ncbi:MAG TPA: adenylate/guanylate cyclase domain-containing protein [Gemmataceae bacterium]|nr:adenylate/guanylate cyclase domain-containing protein [Gemmataceae bacterium]